MFLLISLAAFSQESKVNGVIYDEENKPISNATITLYNTEQKNKIIAYSFSDEKGGFSMQITERKSAFLVIIAMGFKKIEETITLNSKLRYILEYDSKTLETVVIKASPVVDTLRIKTDKMNLTENSTLRDILNKTEGFMVSKEGAISYQGVPINKVLINKKEVFINQNKIALDNLNFEIMENVQLINNYKDKFKIDFDNFNSSVINVNTKKEFTGVVKVTAEAGAGFKESFQIKPKAFYFSEKVNVFTTNNTNNIGERDNNVKDLVGPFIKNTSEYFRNSLLPFFVEDELLKKDINSNTNVIVRKQNEKSKTGLNFSYNRMDQEKSVFAIVSLADVGKIAKEENSLYSTTGNLFTANLMHNMLMGDKAVLSYGLSFGKLNHKNSLVNNTNYFGPNAVMLKDDYISKPDNAIVSNNLTFTKLFNEKFLFNTDFSYTYQNSNSSVIANLSSNNVADKIISQDLEYLNHKVDINAEVERRYNNLLSVKLNVSYSLFKDINHANAISTRSYQIFNPSIAFRGDNKTITYDFIINTGLYMYDYKKAIKSNFSPTLILNLRYRFNRNSNISFGIDQSNSITDFSNTIDSIVLSYNNRLISNERIKFNLTHSKSYDLGYNYSNIAQSKSFYISVKYLTDKNYLNTTFDSLKNNIFYYSNHIINKRKDVNFKMGGSKGIYFSPLNHRLDFSASLMLQRSHFPAELNGTFSNYKNEMLSYNFKAQFAPKSFFLSAINIVFIKSYQNMYLEHEKINSNRTSSMLAELEANFSKWENRAVFGYDMVTSDAINFNTPRLDVSSRFKLSSKLSIYLKGKSLLNLFNLNSSPYTSFSSSSDGNLINQVFNRYRMMYIISGLSYKF